MKFVEIPGLGAGELVLVNPELVSAIVPLTALTRPQGMPAKANCLVYVGGQVLAFPQTAVAFRALIENRGILAS